MFPYSLSAADLGVVILHDSVSRGSVPSKAYNLMSFGIPALYIAADDSELARYAKEFGNAGCFAADRPYEMSAFVRRLAHDPAANAAMRARAESAAGHFRLDNADRFVSSYFSER
jgi:glycosyltransferase involved in cell wall biosynthesis